MNFQLLKWRILHFRRDYYDFDATITPEDNTSLPIILVCCVSWFILLSVVLGGMKCIEWVCRKHNL